MTEPAETLPEAVRGETIRALVEDFAGRGERLAVHAIDGDRRWTYAELEERALAGAAGLCAMGLARGDRVLVLAPNQPEWVAAALGSILAGGAIVPLDSAMAMDHLTHAIRDSNARWAFTTTKRLDILREAAGDRDLGIFLIDDPEPGEEAQGTTGWADLLDRGGQDELPSLGPEDVAAHFYTSGTSGLPKGVPLTHRNIVSNVEALLAAGFIGSDERACVPLPLYHVYPFVVGMLVPLAAGATIVLPAGVSGPQLAEALKDGRVTILIGVPRLYEALLSAIRNRVERRGRIASAAFAGLLKLSGAARSLGLNVGPWLFSPVRRGLAPDLRLLASGGARLDGEVAGSLQRLGWQVSTGYGLTETSPIVCLNVPGEARLETAGRPLTGVEVRIGEPGEDGVGEVQVKGPNVFHGYHDLPDRTAEAFADEDWFRTGDIGRMDDEGYLHLAGRRSSTIVLADGKNIDPEGLEERYAEHPLIREIAIVEDQGRLAALVVPDTTALRDADEGDLHEAIGRSLAAQAAGWARHLRISAFAATSEALPRTPLGKIRRGEIGDAYRSAKEGRPRARESTLSAKDEQLLESPGAREVWEWLGERFPDKPVRLDANLAVDLGIDSLEWVSLTLDLQEVTGLHLTEAVLARVETVRDLLEEASETDGNMEMPEPATLTADQERWVTPATGSHHLLASLLYGLIRILFSVLFPLRVRGAEHFPDAGPLVITANHTSFLDAPALAAGMGRATLGRTFWAGYDQITHRNAFWRFISRAAQVFPVNARTAPVSSLSYARAVLEKGNVLVWFPEGRRTTDGRLGRFTPGIGVVLEETDARVLPTAILGAHRAWPTSRMLPRPGRIEVVYGEPRSPAELEARGTGETRAARLASGLRLEVADLLGDFGDDEDGVESEAD